MTDLNKIQGSIPPLITPFRNGEVDYDSYRTLIDFQINRGTHGILVNGTTAEPSTLTIIERNRLVTTAVECVDGRVPIVAATGSQSLAETRELTDHAVAAGVDALLVVTPYYIRPPQRGLIEYYMDIASRHETPWMIYHIPGRTVVSVTLDTLKTIKDRSPHFVGMKHACERSRFRIGMSPRIWPRFQDIRGPGGTELSDDDHRRMRLDERRRQSAPRCVVRA